MFKALVQTPVLENKANNKAIIMGGMAQSVNCMLLEHESLLQMSSAHAKALQQRDKFITQCWCVGWGG